VLGDLNDFSRPRVALESLCEFIENCASEKLFHTVISIIWDCVRASSPLAWVRGFPERICLFSASWKDLAPFVRDVLAFAANAGAAPHLRAAAFGALRSFFLKMPVPRSLDDLDEEVIAFFEQFREADARVWRKALRFLGAFLHENGVPRAAPARLACVRAVHPHRTESDIACVGCILTDLLASGMAVGDADARAAAEVRRRRGARVWPGDPAFVCVAIRSRVAGARRADAAARPPD
jgi:hypothetical protein